MSGPEDANEIEESNSTRPSVSINTAGLQGKFLSHLQRLLDIVAFHFSGASGVDATSYKEYRPFQSIDVVADRKLDFETARKESERWVLTNCVRDMIEASHLFLEECRIVAALALVSKEGKISGEDFNRIVADERKRFHDLGLPQKLQALRKEFSVLTDLEKHLLSLNRMRACLVHRLGVVSDKDIDESGNLIVLWRTAGLWARSPDGTDEFVLDRPGIEVKGGWSVEVRINDRSKVFRPGQRIELNQEELFSSIFTGFAFVTAMVRSIDELVQRMGIPVIQSLNPESRTTV